jgi:hypothetical protein
LRLDRPKPWLHITLGIILALALTLAINLLTVRYGEKIGYEHPMRALEAQNPEQATRSVTIPTLEYIWQQPSYLHTIIFSLLIAFSSASLAYLILNHLLKK